MLDLPPSSNDVGSAHIQKMPSSSTIGLDEEEDLTFDSPQDETTHYREKYRRILDMLDETRAELDEFQASSKELEDELERELQATEKQQAELKEKINRLEGEKEEWKAKHVALQKLHSSTTGAMQREMDNLRSERDKTLVALRDLEMGNDELERNERVALSSLLDLESKYNRAIEEKTLLEQESVQRQELEEECQRLKDDVRDANNEIAILRDQLARSVPTPPSSVSVPMSPVQEASLELSQVHDPSANTDESETFAASESRQTSTPEPPTRRSESTSSNPTLSPAVKRYSNRFTEAPPALSHLARSATSRNLAQSVATRSLPQSTTSGSPAISRRSGIPVASPPPRKNVNPNLAAKTKGFRLLHDLQARLKATDDKLGTKVPRRYVSGPMPLGLSRRNASTATSATAPAGKAAHSRVATLAAESTPSAANKSGATFLSPNGWVLVSDGEDTPTNQPVGLPETDPTSPIEGTFRPTSSASNKPLPTRPGIPSPLASSVSRAPAASRVVRPPSRGTGSALASSTSTRPASRQALDQNRPFSPSVLPQSTRSYMRSPTPTFGQAMSTSTSASSSRPSSRQTQRTLGRGYPPSSMGLPDDAGLGLSTQTPLRRQSRRSSLGAAEALLPPTGIPAPNRTPSRPTSVHAFGQSTPPPVPRIPSAHLKASHRDKDKKRGVI